MNSAFIIHRSSFARCPLPGRASPLQYSNLMESTNRTAAPSPPLVALLGWVLPGGGYLLLGQYGRAMGVGITIILLFLLGLLIGGIRVIEVPGYDVATGDPVMTTMLVQVYDTNSKKTVIEPARDPVSGEVIKKWAMEASPLNEIRDKPWSVPQALAGPMAIVSGYFSVKAAAIDPDAPIDPMTNKHSSYGALSHARVNEISSLYLSVAGLLNLMAIIDAAWRASHINEQWSLKKEPA
jgi:hypothetical protein